MVLRRGSRRDAPGKGVGRGWGPKGKSMDKDWIKLGGPGGGLNPGPSRFMLLLYHQGLQGK